MALPEFMKRLVKKEIQRLVDRVPGNVRDQVRNEYEFIGKKVTLFECRANWEYPKDPNKWSKLPVAQFRYDPDEKWNLYWRRSNGRWKSCEWIKPQESLAKLVDEVEKDTFGTFWG